MKKIIYGFIIMAIFSATISCNKTTTEPDQTVATPSFSPGGGSYTSAQIVSISCATTGATIRYTTNGSDPTPNSTLYGTPINVSASTTIKAKAYKSGYTDSGVATATYTISNAQTVATPTFNPSGGNYSTTQTVSIFCSTSGATVRYTTNGSTPTSSSSVYNSPINISSNTTIKAKAFKSGWSDSAVASATYNITPDNWIAATYPSNLSGNWLDPDNWHRFTVDGQIGASPIYITDRYWTYSLFATDHDRIYKNGNMYRIQAQQQITLYAYTFFFNNVSSSSMSACVVQGYVSEPAGEFIQYHKR